MPVVWGNVQAVTTGLETSSRSISVATRTAGFKTTIDAQINGNTLIVRGFRTVALSDIKAGEWVELSYVQTGNRAEACTVYLRA
jgi:hypothetical protein